MEKRPAESENENGAENGAKKVKFGLNNVVKVKHWPSIDHLIPALVVL